MVCTHSTLVRNYSTIFFIKSNSVVETNFLLKRVISQAKQAGIIILPLLCLPSKLKLYNADSNSFSLPNLISLRYKICSSHPPHHHKPLSSLLFFLYRYYHFVNHFSALAIQLFPMILQRKKQNEVSMAIRVNMCVKKIPIKLPSLLSKCINVCITSTCFLS